MGFQELMIILSPFIFMLVIGSLVIHWAKKTGRYLFPSAFGVLAHTAVIPAIVLFATFAGDQNPARVIEDYGPAFLIVAFCIVTFTGMAVSVFAVLYVSGNRVPALLLLVVFVVITGTPVLDGIEFDPVLYVESVLQGDETGFAGHRIYVGNTYLYSRLGEGLEIRKIRPGYSGVEDGFYLTAKTGSRETIADVNLVCQDENSNCIRSDRGTYQTVALQELVPSDDYGLVPVYYYRIGCDGYLKSFTDGFEGDYADFARRFFRDNC